HFPFEFWHFNQGDAMGHIQRGRPAPARFGPVHWDPQTNRVTPVDDPLTPLNPLPVIEREVSAALQRAEFNLAMRLRASNKMNLREEVTADHNAAEREECLVDVVAPFEARAQAAHLMQPTDRAFDDPARCSQTAAMLGVSLCQYRFDAAVAQLFAMGLRV